MCIKNNDRSEAKVQFEFLSGILAQDASEIIIFFFISFKISNKKAIDYLIFNEKWIFFRIDYIMQINICINI